LFNVLVTLKIITKQNKKVAVSVTIPSKPTQYKLLKTNTSQIFVQFLPKTKVNSTFIPQIFIKTESQIKAQNTKTSFFVAYDCKAKSLIEACLRVSNKDLSIG
jgi:hypothetical protein